MNKSLVCHLLVTLKYCSNSQMEPIGALFLQDFLVTVVGERKLSKTSLSELYIDIEAL